MQFHPPHLQVAVLGGRLERGVAGEHAVDVALLARQQLLHLEQKEEYVFSLSIGLHCNEDVLIKSLHHLLVVAVGRGLHQLLRHVARHVRLEELLQQCRQTLCNVYRFRHG